jgi:hypothetical protein
MSRQGQEDSKFKASLGYIARPVSCLRKIKPTTKESMVL